MSLGRLLALSLSLLSGCHEHPQIEPQRHPARRVSSQNADKNLYQNGDHYIVSGLVAGTNANPVFVDLETLGLAPSVGVNEQLTALLATSEKILVRKSHNGKTSNFNVLLAVGGKSGYQESTGRIREFSSGRPVFHIDAGTGVAIIGGTCPAAQTDWIAAGSDGTTIAIEVPNKMMCRVFLIKKSSAQSYVWFRDPNGSVISGVQLDKEYTYYEIDNQRHFSNVLDVNGGNRKAMIDELVSQANLAGWPDRLP